MTSKISVYSLPDLKATTDEALCTYLTSLGLSQSFVRQDIRLVLGYALVAIGAGAFYAERKLGWEQTKDWMLPLVVLYFSINAAFTAWSWFGEREIVFEGVTKKDQQKICISSHVDSYDPTYRLTITASSSSSKPTSPTSPTSTSNRQTETKISGPFSRWFTKDGQFGTLEFHEWLCSSSPVIANLEPRKFARTAVPVGDSRIYEILEEESRGGETGREEKPVTFNLTPENTQQTVDRLNKMAADAKR